MSRRRNSPAPARVAAEPEAAVPEVEAVGPVGPSVSGSRGDWVLTLRQGLPDFFRLAGALEPTLHLPSPAELGPSVLGRLGARAVIWDLDGTLVPHGASRIPPEIRRGVAALLDRPGLRHVLLSNRRPAGCRALDPLLAALPLVRGFQAPGGPRFVVEPPAADAEGGSGGGASAAGERATSAGGRPLRKPSVPLVRAAIEALGCDPAEAVLVGDQYFTDVAPGNLAGTRTVKVPSLPSEGRSAAVRWLQRAERAVYRVGRAGSP